MLRCVAATLRHSLDRLPGGERTQFGLLTYDSTLHFYNLNGAAAQMLVVTEIDELFTPMPGEVLVNLLERKEVVAALLDKLPAMFASNQPTDTCLGPALRAAYAVSQHVGGKLAVFTASRPTVGEGKLMNREGAAPAAQGGRTAPADAKGGGGVLAPATEFYKNFAVDCSKQQLCVDVWNCNSKSALHTTLPFPSFQVLTLTSRLSASSPNTLAALSITSPPSTTPTSLQAPTPNAPTLLTPPPSGSYADLATLGQLAKHIGGSVYQLPAFHDSPKPPSPHPRCTHTPHPPTRRLLR
jgi:hypothetical protein